MSRTVNPSSFVSQMTPQLRQWVQSVHKSLNNGIDMGVGTGTNPATGGVNAGVYTQFERGNGSGILVRIAAIGSTSTGAAYNWPSSGPLVINHTLGRQPIGFYVVDADKAVQVYRAAPPSATTIAVSATDTSASVTLYIF